MKVGIVSENRAGEKRAILRPQELKGIALVSAVLVEKGAGRGVGIKDSAYKAAGAQVADRRKVYSCPLVVRLKRPSEEELSMMKPGSAIMSMMHFEGNPGLLALFKKYKITAIAMDELKDSLGRRKVEALHQTGYLGMGKGFELWAGDPSKCLVKVMGYGNVAAGAIQRAARKFARVIVLNKKDFKNMSKHIPGTDILVNAINWPAAKRGKEFIITKDMLKLFKKGAVITDLVSNPAGQSPIETMRPTAIKDISYRVKGVIHTSCWGWPGLDPVNITRRYSIQVAPVIKDIVGRRPDKLEGYIKRAMHK